MMQEVTCNHGSGGFSGWSPSDRKVNVLSTLKLVFSWRREAGGPRLGVLERPLLTRYRRFPL